MPTPSVRAAAIAAIGMIKDREAVDPLIRCLTDRELIIRIGAAEVLGKLGDRRATGPLKDLEHDPFSEVREAAEAASKKDSGKNLNRYSAFFFCLYLIRYGHLPAILHDDILQKIPCCSACIHNSR